MLGRKSRVIPKGLKLKRKDKTELKCILALDHELDSKLELSFNSSDLATSTRESFNSKDLKPEERLRSLFAVIRKVSAQVLGMKHFDSQIIGGYFLHKGTVAEMKTGEGKTLVATLPAIYAALDGQKVFIVTVNDYLAKRDAEWMSPLYEAFGLTVGVSVPNLTQDEKRKAYSADIIYVTSNEIGFDYLRDNMVQSAEEKLLPSLDYAIVDEVDSILIDEARTPLIISGMAENFSSEYRKLKRLVPKLKRQMRLGTDDEPLEEAEKGDFYVDEADKQIDLTEQGIQKVEALVVSEGLLKEGESLYSNTNIKILRLLQTTLKAHYLFEKDVDYLVQNKRVVLVDEHTGRLMPGRRLSDGLHQAIEVKESVQVQPESKTLASITFQNFFRMFKRLSGMTGTAKTEEEEFKSIYGLEVVEIPTNKPMTRKDHEDIVYGTQQQKFDAIVQQIDRLRAENAPVLVGTASVDNSEKLSRELNRQNITHNVLNAKHHEKEAQIIAQAGRPGAITIATNMAGRGTDIVLGGNWEMLLAKNADKETKEKAHQDWIKDRDTVLAAGGLHIVGTERNESRRIDDQLRGRSGRQGDPGSSQFFLSLEDDLLRLFTTDRTRSMLMGLGLDGDSGAIRHSMLSRAIRNAQKRIEGRNFDVRKQLLEYDTVANEQRRVIYEQRDYLLKETDASPLIADMRKDLIEHTFNQFVSPDLPPKRWKIQDLMSLLKLDFGLEIPVDKYLEQDNKLTRKGLLEKVMQACLEIPQQLEEKVDKKLLRQFELRIMLGLLDNQWRDHLDGLNQLRQNVHLRAYAQKNPRQEFKREAFEMFEILLQEWKDSVVKFLYRVKVEPTKEPLVDDKVGSVKAVKQDFAVSRAAPTATSTSAQVNTEASNRPQVALSRKQRRAQERTRR